MNTFKELIKYQAGFRKYYNDLTRDEQIELILAYAEGMNTPTDDRHEVTLSLPISDLQYALFDKICTEKFRIGLANALEEIYGEAIEHKLQVEVEYQIDPQSPQRELMMNINSENRKRQSIPQAAHKWRHKEDRAC